MRIIIFIFFPIIVFMVAFGCVLCWEAIKRCIKSKEESQCETAPTYSTEQPPPYSEFYIDITF